ncbi:hypothetical protein D3870_00040 [Noviherbaspirillum cavernae]|uniref:Uncharacterized protein n=1 Tax=Noviherbaspirillum cavernae TaxID=2320862 RepID=A0A418X780_9BURK|nr:hypothetical protein [Noviherbaspirillum cavernae]RJG08332.1 hypothetical protein D3870_00040 [Noviherbaspirillum cavernae]
MKTAAISNPANVNSATASSAKQSGDASGLPFSELLSREVADRGAVNEAAMPATRESRPAAATPQSARPAAKSDKADSADTDTAAVAESGATAASEDAAVAAQARPSLPPTTQRKPRRPHWQPHPRNCSPWLPT